MSKPVRNAEEVMEEQESFTTETETPEEVAEITSADEAETASTEEPEQTSSETQPHTGV